MAAMGKYAGMYLGDPDIDFVKLAGSQGVAAQRVEASGDLRAAIKRGIAATRDGKPYLIEVLVSRIGDGAPLVPDLANVGRSTGCRTSGMRRPAGVAGASYSPRFTRTRVMGCCS